MAPRALALALALALTACVASSGSSSAPEASAPAASSKDEAASSSSPRGEGVASRIELAGATFSIMFEDPEDPPLPLPVAEAWVRRSASMVADYYGGTFPVESLRINLIGSRRHGVGFGQHWDGRLLAIRVGEGTSPETLERDWVMVHEMLHAAYPDLEREHLWMQEGLSTYLEPVVRARAGNVSAEYVWSRWVRMMGNGRPRSGDRGLDITRTWGRLYWGGALFWLVVDVEIRKQSDNRVGLREALQGIVAAGGNGRADWSTARCVELGDQATQTRALSEVYARMAKAPGDVDLDALWRELGVVPDREGGVSFDDDAPLAELRRAMTE